MQPARRADLSLEFALQAHAFFEGHFALETGIGAENGWKFLIAFRHGVVLLTIFLDPVASNSAAPTAASGRGADRSPNPQPDYGGRDYTRGLNTYNGRFFV